VDLVSVEYHNINDIHQMKRASIGKEILQKEKKKEISINNHSKREKNKFIIIIQL